MVSLGCYGRSGAAVPSGTAGAVEDLVLTVLESDLAAFRCRVKPRSRVREEASVVGASRLAPPPEWSKNSFFRESAEVIRCPARGRKLETSYRTRDSEGRKPARARKLLYLMALARSDEEAWPKCRSGRPASG